MTQTKRCPSSNETIQLFDKYVHLLSPQHWMHSSLHQRLPGHPPLLHRHIWYIDIALCCSTWELYANICLERACISTRNYQSNNQRSNQCSLPNLYTVEWEMVAINHQVCRARGKASVFYVVLCRFCNGTFETDGEPLHAYIEDGLAKHLKIQASLSSLSWWKPNELILLWICPFREAFFSWGTACCRWTWSQMWIQHLEDNPVDAHAAA